MGEKGREVGIIYLVVFTVVCIPVGSKGIKQSTIGGQSSDVQGGIEAARQVGWGWGDSAKI